MVEVRMEELQEIKKLKELQQEERNLRNKINKFSTYNAVQISNAIAKLMTVFEGIEYYCSKVLFLDCDYYIRPKSNNIYIYPSYKIKNVRQEEYFSSTSDKLEICYLPPSSFKINTLLQHNPRNKEIEYIQLFIDYLYERRINKSLEEISKIQLEEILQDFLKITYDLQQQRKMEIADKMKSRIKQQKRKEFEESCIIDRKLIYNSLAYIINHYEENMVAKEQTDEKWSHGTQWSELCGYHKLIIEYKDQQIIYSTIVDKIGCYPDEEHCYRGFHINTDKDTNIPFFDIKNKLLPIINNSNYIKTFIDMIENLYNEGKTITPDSIQEFLILISNKNKVKQRTLIKK